MPDLVIIVSRQSKKFNCEVMAMHTTIEIQGKPVDVLTTKEADAILSS